MSQKVPSRLTITLPEPHTNPVSFEFDGESCHHLTYKGNGATTAPIFLATQDDESPQQRLPRRFSFGNTTKGFAVGNYGIFGL